MNCLPLVLFASLPAALLALGLAGSAVAQDVAADPVQPAFAGPPPFERVLWDEGDDGTWWARARRYKLQVTSDAVAFTPALGAKAPHNFPLLLRPVECRVGEVALPLVTPRREREGDIVTLDRGALREVWRLDRDTAEQDFVLDLAGQNAAILVRLAVETVCGSPTAEADGSLYFPAGEYGGIRYGHMVVVDGAGKRLVQPSVWRDGGIELLVPAAFVRDAVGPITIDPVIQTISIDTSAGTQRFADVAYVSGPDVWLAVYEDVVSATDIDIISRRYTRAGAFLDEVAVDISNDHTESPSVAGNRALGQFLVAWQRNPAGIGPWRIRARVRTAANAVQAAPFTIDSTLQGLVFDPRVGGSLGTAGADFCVVWNKVDNFSTVESAAIFAGAPGTIRTVLSGSRAAISKTSGPGQAWLVCLHLVVANVSLAHCRILDSLGNIVGSQVPLGPSSFGRIDVAGDGIDFLVVWEREIGINNLTIMGQRVRLIGSPVLLGGNVDLIATQPGPIPSRDQRRPSVAGSGCRYVLTYEEDALGAGNAEIFMATMTYNTTPFFIDGHVSLSTVPGLVNTGGIAMTTDTGDTGLPVALATFSSANVFGSLIDMLDPLGGITVQQTGCGGFLFEPVFNATGTPALGYAVTMTLTPGSGSSLPFIVLGSPTNNPVTLCSIGCKQGVGTILASVFGASHTLNVPCNAGLLGMRLAAQGVEMLAAQSSQGGCPTSLFGAPFRVSDTLVLRLQ